MPDLNSTVAFPSQDCTPNVEDSIDDAKDLRILDSKLQISTTLPKTWRENVKFVESIYRCCQIGLVSACIMVIVSFMEFNRDPNGWNQNQNCSNWMIDKLLYKFEMEKREYQKMFPGEFICEVTIT